MTKDEQGPFGEGFSEDLADEAGQGRGETDPWQDSQKRMSERTKKDWTRIQAEVEESNAAFGAAMDSGLPATSTEAMRAAENHRLHIRRWFYEITPELHRELGDRYVTDPRFTKNYENIRAGMAQYVRDAIHGNADRSAGASPAEGQQS